MSDITIRYENQYFLIVDKPAKVIVHEGAYQKIEDGEWKIEERRRLLTDWIAENRPEITKAFVGEEDIYYRPGIVHRLDKDTSGLLIIAKDPEVKQKLQRLFKNRQVTKEYVALVLGKPQPEQGSIVTFITRDPNHRRQMAVSFVGKGKEARTDYQLVKSYSYRYKGQTIPISLVDITLHSGRMHQIRVHMKSKGWPVIGDQTYYTKISRNISKELGLARQFLHAKQLTFEHPITHKRVNATSPLPSDLELVIDQLEKYEA